MSSAGLDPDSPLKIAYLTYRGKPHVGGQGVYTRHLTKALCDLGHSVEVFGGQPYPILDERVKLTKLPSLDTFNEYFPGRLPGFWFEGMDEPRGDGGGAIHIAIWLPHELAEARVTAALAAGGRLVRDHSPAWWTLADAAGNEADVATIKQRD